MASRIRIKCEDCIFELVQLAPEKAFLVGQAFEQSTTLKIPGMHEIFMVFAFQLKNAIINKNFFPLKFESERATVDSVTELLSALAIHHHGVFEKLCEMGVNIMNSYKGKRNLDAPIEGIEVVSFIKQPLN
jgi:hypothetical protein